MSSRIRRSRKWSCSQKSRKWEEKKNRNLFIQSIPERLHRRFWFVLVVNSGWDINKSNIRMNSNFSNTQQKKMAGEKFSTTDERKKLKFQWTWQKFIFALVQQKKRFLSFIRELLRRFYVFSTRQHCRRCGGKSKAENKKKNDKKT